MHTGIGYQGYKKHLISEGYTSSEIEDKGKEKYIIYFGRAYVEDHETKAIARGPLKIGRGKYATALMRGRNQPGIDFRIYFEIVLETNQATYECEKVIKEALSHRNIIGTQGQRELYDIKDKELKNCVLTLCQIINEDTHNNIIEVNQFNRDKRILLDYVNKKKITLEQFF